MKTIDQTTDLFFSLTPEKVLEAVERSGLRCNSVCYPLNSFENRVYEVELEDRSRLVAKFYRPKRWSEAQILEEHQFLADLEAEEIPVCAPLPFPGGGTLRRMDEIAYCLYERRGGRAPQELSDEAVARLGMLAARLHNVGARRQSLHRVQLNADTYIRDNLRWLQANHTLPAHIEHRYLTAANAIAGLTDSLMEGVQTNRIHGDFHLGNIIERDERFWLLDFDDMVIGPAVQDLWLALPGRDAHTRRQRMIFIDAYEQLRSFDHTSLRLIEPLRSLRFIHYATWLARRWHDPIFPITWPHFGTDAYWEQETDDLEEQLAIIRNETVTIKASPENGNGASPGNGKEPLTNKDFFWDWED